MNLLTLIIFLFLFLTEFIEKKYPKLLFIKMFLLSFMYFYYINITNKTILTFLLTIVFLILIIALVYRSLNNNDSPRVDNTIFQIAHEVKNPIAVCKGYLEMLDIEDEEKVKKYIPIVKKEMNRALSIMDEFLNLKRITISKDLMDFSLLLEDINETMHLVLNDNTINLAIPKIDDELIIDGDYDKLKQVLINLIKNSYEANAKNIILKIKRVNKKLNISIIDDGDGIQDLKKIGNVFYTTKVMGTGIGVSMSKEIAKLHNGNIYYESIIGEGTTATLTLPLKYVF